MLQQRHAFNRMQCNASIRRDTAISETNFSTRGEFNAVSVLLQFRWLEIDFMDFGIIFRSFESESIRAVATRNHRAIQATQELAVLLNDFVTLDS